MDAALAALGCTALTEEGDEVVTTGLAEGLAVALRISLATGFITDLATDLEGMTSLAVDFLASTAFLTPVFDTGLTILEADVLSAGLTVFVAATWAEILFFLTGTFTSCLLWAVASG
jgi:hypothetical protein